MLKRLIDGIRDMPRPAYIVLRAALELSCLMLLVSAALFMEIQSGADFSRLYPLAITFLKNPAGLLLTGTIGVAFLLDRS